MGTEYGVHYGSLVQRWSFEKDFMTKAATVNEMGGLAGLGAPGKKRCLADELRCLIAAQLQHFGSTCPG